MDCNINKNTYVDKEQDNIVICNSSLKNMRRCEHMF